jgi:hypothetical protein
MLKYKPEDVAHYLTLKKRIEIKGRMVWLCECQCGKQVTRREDYLRKNRVGSCGCKNPMKDKKGSLHHCWKGCGELSSQHFNVIRVIAAKRGLEFAITIEEAWNLFVKQDRKCKLTGLPLQFSGQRQRKAGIPQTASLDRIDSKKGYTLDNVQWVHKDVNLMKKEYSQERFIEICRLVAEHQKSSRERIMVDQLQP